MGGRPVVCLAVGGFPDDLPAELIREVFQGAAAKVAGGDAELLITLVSEILPAPGVELVGPLPAAFQHYVSFAAATGAKATNPDAGKALIACLSGPSVAATLKAKGMDKP